MHGSLMRVLKVDKVNTVVMAPLDPGKRLPSSHSPDEVVLNARHWTICLLNS